MYMCFKVMPEGFIILSVFKGFLIGISKRVFYAK
jgi:hypothetical protein